MKIKVKVRRKMRTLKKNKLFIVLLALILILPMGQVFASNPIRSVDIKLNVRTVDQTIKMGTNNVATATVEIQNPTSNVDVTDLTAQAVIDNPTTVFVNGDGYLFNGVKDSIAAKKSKTGTISLRTENIKESTTVPVKIVLRYYVNNDFREQVETVYVRVEVANAKDPAIEIRKVDSLWPTGVEAGKSFQVGFQVINTGDAVAKNIKIKIDGLKDDGITLASGLTTSDITRLEPKQSTYITYNLKTNKTIKPGSFMLSLKYSFVGELSPSSTPPTTGDYEFTIDVLKSSEEPSNLEFKDVTFPTGTILRNQSVSIGFNLVNTGKTPINDIKVTATSTATDGLASKSISTVNTKVINPNAMNYYKFDFIVTPAAQTMNYPVELKAVYTDDDGVERTVTQNTGVFVKAPKEGTGTENSSTPKLIIEEYFFTPDIIEAGKPFTMHLTIFNTNANKTVKNIKLFLTSDAQEKAGEQQGGQAPSSASVFTPIDSSNTFFIDSIAPGKRVDKEITLTTVPDTAAKTYTIVANFEYEDAKAEKFTSTEQIGVPVVQQAKLGLGEILAQGPYTVGMESPLSLEFYNTGKATLYNVMVKITGDGFTTDTPTYYKGNFTPGSSDQFSCNITPTEAGQKKATITFTYEDSTGNTQEKKEEFDFTVEDMPEMSEDEMAPPAPQGPSKGAIIGIISAIAAAVVAAVLIIKKRKNKNKDLEI